MNTKTAAGISAIVIALSAGIFSVSAMGNSEATSTDPSTNRPRFAQRMGQKMGMHREGAEHRQAMQDALASGDYSAWKEAMPEDAPILDVITADNFDQFVQMHQLMKDGDKDGAEAIAKELGLPDKVGMGKNFGQFKKGPKMRQEQMEAARAAIEAGDYDAWKATVGEDAPVLEHINQDNFGRFVEMHSLRNQARSIAEELGLQGPGMKRGQR